ncbi:MAG: hypothetical protein JXN64_09505 [Spirochaetes bacterium]|nr:hypothetical protein [Spirochaetota bacterium]
MIFIIIAALILSFSVYVFRMSWSKTWARWSYAVNILLICIILILFGLQYKIDLTQASALRRTIVAAVDISASSGLRMEGFTGTADEILSDYNLEIIPFSDEVKGIEGTESTAMIESLKSILAYISGRYRNDEVAGFTVITDGNETEKIDELKNDLPLTGGFPHNVVYLNTGSGNINFDKSVSIIKAPRFMTKYSKERIYFSVSTVGAGLEGVPVNLKLNGKNIATTYVRLSGGYGEGSFDLVIKNAGVNLLEASVAADSRETITDNNRDYALVEGIYKGFRVLHISGHPSADTAFIRRGLQNIPGVDMISFYILRTDTQVYKARDNELSLIPFPTDQLFRNELDNFDLIIINDFQLNQFLNAYYINNIVKFVQSGGGLLILGGPLSFKYEDLSANNFESILPFAASTGMNFDAGEYLVKPNKLSAFAGLAELGPIKNLRIKGINRVNLKDWANVFYATESGLPVIVGGIKDKARMLVVLTDSFWKFSYNSGMPNEAALKCLIRFTLGIPSIPVVDISNNTVSFANRFKSLDDYVYARIRFMSNDGRIIKNVMLKPSIPYPLLESDSRLLNISIEQNGRIIDKFDLINYHEKKWHEHSYLPMGKIFLQNFAKNGYGDFISVEKSGIGHAMKGMNFKKPVVISEQKQEKSPLYEHRLFLLIFLYLVISSFYLKSRYAD